MQEELSTGEKIQNAKCKNQNYNSKLKINKFKCSSLRGAGERNNLLPIWSLRVTPFC